MAVCIRNIGQVGRNAILIFMMCILAGCAKDFSNTTEMSMKYKKEFILDEKTEEAETFYENGEPAGGRLLELKDGSAVWFDENSVWCKDNAENVQLYPGEEWQEITVYINQVEWKKYVRCQENHN